MRKAFQKDGRHSAEPGQAQRAQDHRSGCGADEASYRVDQRGLARAIGAEQADDFTGGRLATEHLISLGHRRIGFQWTLTAARNVATITQPAN